MTMTLEQVLNWHRSREKVLRGGNSTAHKEMAEAIDVHLAQLRAAPISTKADKLTIDAAFQRRCSDEFKASDMSWRPSANSAFIAGWRAKEAHLTQPAQSVDDSALLNFMERECVTVRCEATDDDDVEWDVVSYHMDAPKERVIGTGATPREALTAALQEKGNG